MTNFYFVANSRKQNCLFTGITSIESNWHWGFLRAAINDINT